MVVIFLFVVLWSTFFGVEDATNLFLRTGKAGMFEPNGGHRATERFWDMVTLLFLRKRGWNMDLFLGLDKPIILPMEARCHYM